MEVELKYGGKVQWSLSDDIRVLEDGTDDYMIYWSMGLDDDEEEEDDEKISKPAKSTNASKSSKASFSNSSSLAKSSAIAISSPDGSAAGKRQRDESYRSTSSRRHFEERDERKLAGSRDRKILDQVDYFCFSMLC